ncbi:MAG TPA: ABC transporter permease [Caldilineaceae bacterium]|nr:ABC transporter permease [Caldilineaceae bacterium]
MSRYLLSRLGQSIVLLVGVLVLVFLMMRLTGDPASLLVPREATPEQRAAARAALGLDQPLPVQFFEFMTSALTGDFGNSLRYKQPAIDLILQRLPATVELATAALLLAVLLGVPLGLLAGSRPGTFWDLLSRGIGLLGQTLPSFWLALMLIIIFAVNLRVLPSFGRETWAPCCGIRLPTSTIILPAFALSIFTMGQLVRFTRSAVLEVRNEDYIRTAFSKGLPQRQVYTRHILRNVAIPLISILGVQFGYLLSGSIYIETIFSWPGLGNLLAEAVGNRDFALVQALAFFTSVVVILLHLASDIAYAFADPRIRYRG